MHLLLRTTLLVALVSACGSRPPAVATAAPLLQPASCTDGEAPERLVVDWPALERAKLEAVARRGVVLVHVEGCVAKIVEGCRSKRRYDYTPTSRQREVTTMRDRDEVAAKLPLGAARFSAGVGADKSLSVSMTVVGRYETTPDPMAEHETSGSCGDATHVVSSFAVGSFEIASTSAATASAAAEIAVAGARASSAASRTRLDSAGVEARCAEASRNDDAPPQDCGIPLRLELRRLGVATPKPEPPPPAPPDAMKRASMMAKRELAPCYRRALANDAKLEGNLTLMISVGPEGRVKSVSAKHDVPESLAECAISRIERVTFPSADGDKPRVFVLPFVFHGSG